MAFKSNGKIYNSQPCTTKILFGQHQAGRGGPFFFVLTGEAMPEKPVVLEDGLETGCASWAVGEVKTFDFFLYIYLKCILNNKNKLMRWRKRETVTCIVKYICY